jgi:hypothetical protein
MPHELVHWHVGGLLGPTNPADQLVANVGELGDGLKVVCWNKGADIIQIVVVRSLVNTPSS